MTPSASRPSLLQRIQTRLAQARFLTFSALLHLFIVIMAGSVVLIKNIAEPPDFEAGEGGLLSAEPPSAQPPQPPQAENVEFQPVQPSATAPNLTAITSTAVTPASFQLAASSQVRNLDAKMAAAGAGLGDKMNEKLASMAASGMRGGTRTMFGSKEKSVSALVGNFYDMKQTRGKKPSDVDVGEYGKVMTKFVEDGWREGVLNEYFKAPNPLYATQIFIPNMSANEGPKAFEMEKEVQPSRWAVHYKGRVSPPKDGNYRFVGAGDDYLVIRFNGRLVLDHGFSQATDWKADQFYNYGWTSVPKGFARGEKMQLKANQFYDLELLIGERPGGLVFFCLLMEEEGADYKKDGKGNPILPVFRLADGPMPELEQGQTLPPYEPNGPVWRAMSGKPGSGSAFDSFFKN